MSRCRKVPLVVFWGGRWRIVVPGCGRAGGRALGVVSGGPLCVRM